MFEKVKYIPIEELNLPGRAYNYLKRAHINFVGELLSHSDYELLSIPNIGDRSLDQVKKQLLAYLLIHG